MTRNGRKKQLMFKKFNKAEEKLVGTLGEEYRAIEDIYK